MERSWMARMAPSEAARVEGEPSGGGGGPAPVADPADQPGRAVASTGEGGEIGLLDGAGARPVGDDEHLARSPPPRRLRGRGDPVDGRRHR
eukprot:10649365-Lingulodinium_polyedra.AAC.1